MIPGVFAAGAVGEGAQSSYLDSLVVQPEFVLSLRRLISTATVALRVRRSTDNAEQDIGFTNDSLDIASLISFVGAGDGFVVSLYDQTGNGWHSAQAVAPKQPRIVNGGIFDSAVMFDGIDDALVIPTLSMGTQFAGVYSKAALVAASNYKMFFEHSADAASANGGFAFYGNNDSATFDTAMRGATGGARGNRFTADLSVISQLTVLFDRSLTGADEIRAWRNGVLLPYTQTGLGEQTGNFQAHSFHIGARGGTAMYADLILDTLAAYTADSSSVRFDIESIVN